MQIIVHAHSGKWYVGVKEPPQHQHYTGPQTPQSVSKKQYRLWTGKKWAGQYAKAQAFESEEAAQKYVSENKETLEKSS